MSIIGWIANDRIKMDGIFLEVEWQEFHKKRLDINK